MSNLLHFDLHWKVLLYFFTTQSRLLTSLGKKPFENTVEKGENAGNKHFFFFPQYFLPFPKQISLFYIHLTSRLQMLSI